MISMSLPWKITACGADRIIYELINYLLLLVFVAAQTSSIWSEWGLLFVAVPGFLAALASLVAEHRLPAHRLPAHRLPAHRLQQLWDPGLVLHGTWSFPGPRIKPTSPALAGGFLSTVPPEKSPNQVLSLPDLSSDC